MLLYIDPQLNSVHLNSNCGLYSLKDPLMYFSQLRWVNEIIWIQHLNVFDAIGRWQMQQLWMSCIYLSDCGIKIVWVSFRMKKWLYCFPNSKPSHSDLIHQLRKRKPNRNSKIAKFLPLSIEFVPLNRHTHTSNKTHLVLEDKCPRTWKLSKRKPFLSTAILFIVLRVYSNTYRKY